MLELTKREIEVLSLIVKGYTNNEISKALHISLSTSKAHVSNILSKMNTDSRIRAAVLAVRLNMVDVEI